MNNDDTLDDFQNDEQATNPLADMKNDEKLPGDYDPPFSPPSDVPSQIGDTDQATDTNMDSHELYDANFEAASGADMPNESSEGQERIG